MGVKEYAGKVRMASKNVLSAINPLHNPTQDTLSRLLKPFRLRLSCTARARSEQVAAKNLPRSFHSGFWLTASFEVEAHADGRSNFLG